VFSSWKKTLDLVAELLKSDRLKYDMIHGKLTLKQRLKVLKDFKSVLGPDILLMTLGTGAEGFVPRHIFATLKLTSLANQFEPDHRVPDLSP
jgi:hypothetical protein